MPELAFYVFYEDFMKEMIKKYQFKDGLSHEFEILDLSKVLKVHGNIMTAPHRAQFYHILWIEKGAGTHLIDFNPVHIENNTIIFIPKNSVNKFDQERNYTGRGILFTDSFFGQNIDNLKFLNSTILFSDLYGTAKIKIKPSMNLLVETLKIMTSEYILEPNSSQYGILRNLLHTFLLQSEREIREQGFEDLKPSRELELLLSFKELLEKNFQKEKKVYNYAANLNITEKQLHNATSKIMDKTPKILIDERILLEAKRLLVHSAESIKEISYILGYEEPTNFIKYFRKHTNMTPSEFREKY